jgi:hypothetical protein
MLIPCPQCKVLLTPTDPSADSDELVVCGNCGNRFSPRYAAAQQGSTIDRLYKHGDAPAAGIRVDPDDVQRRRLAAVPPGRMRTRNPFATLFWGLTSLVLILTLIGQYAYVQRDELARHVELRPWLEWLCLHAGCELPLMRSPELVRIAGRDIRRHPDIDDALIVNVTMTNHAPYVQAWPVIQLGFYDLRNRPLALRRFTVDEYLPHGLSIEDGIPVQTPIRVRLDIVDPGPEAVNFTFELM